MGRQNYKRIVTSCHRGINQQPELAIPGECADALNVWAPNGRVETRPGFRFQTTYLFGPESIADQIIIIEEGATPTYRESTTTIDFSTPTVQGDSWYFGSSTDLAGKNGFLSIHIDTLNTVADSYATMSYYNGSRWVAIPHEEGFKDGEVATNHLGGEGVYFSIPSDSAQTTVNGNTKHFLKFTLHGSNPTPGTTLDASQFELYTSDFGEQRYVDGLCTLETDAGKRYLTVVHWGTSHVYRNKSRLGLDELFFSDTITEPRRPLPATFAAVPEFRELYVAYGGRVTVHKAAPNSDDNIHATVEDRDEFVGDRAPYSRDYIAQRTGFPQANYITFYNGRLWAAGIDGRSNEIAWSAPSPYYRVWPLLSQEPLVEDDNSPVTGIAGLNEQLVVFKNDSIWIMASDGLNEFGLATYAPIRVVAGVGTVSHWSIQKIRGNLIFLAEDGLYAFDGTPGIRKVTENAQGADRLADFMRSINPSRRQFASSVHWKTKSCYLLSVAVDGSDTNNRTLVWDYKNDSFWIWSGINAKTWLSDEGQFDEERIYFATDDAAIYEFGAGNTDNEIATTANVLTHRMGFGDSRRKMVRQVEVTGSSQCGNMSVSVRPNDDAANETTGTLSFTDTGTFVQKQRRPRRGHFRVPCDHYQVELEQTGKAVPLHVSLIDTGFIELGRR